jgi:hypothetical protein
MATAALIDLSNYDSLLSQSTDSRSGTPDGNIYFDVANGRIEIITVEELATVALYNGVKATQTLTSTGVMLDTETVTIDTKVYTFQTTLTNVDGNVLIGADQTATHLNLLNAMNLTGVAGTDYALSMTLHPTVDGTSSNGTTTVVTSKEQGTASNSIATTQTTTNMTWGAATLLGGTNPTAEANPLTEDLGIKLEALYAFERQERRKDEVLRQYDVFFKGTFKFGGAYELINGRKFDDSDGSATSLTTDDRFKIRSSGWIERNAAGVAGRIYYGSRSLGNIEATSQPYYQLSLGGVPVNFDKDGPIDEAIQVFGDATIDANTTTFDTRTFLSNKVRTFGFNYDEKVLADSGVTEMDGYFSGFALGESVHLTSGAYTIADVYDTQISPWTGMTLEKLAVGQTETGFNEVDGDFTWVLHNTVPGTLNECVAFLDALAQTDDDIDSGAVTVTNGKRVDVWYTYSAAGKIVTQSGADTLGLFIENLPTADQQSIIFTDDIGATKTYPFVVSVEVSVGATAVADLLAWYHAFFLDGPGAGDDFNTAGALTVQDTSSNLIKGNVAVNAVANKIVWPFDYDGDTIGGPGGAATDKDVVFECEGDGGATAAKTVFTINRQTTVAATCAPSLETNV